MTKEFLMAEYRKNIKQGHFYIAWMIYQNLRVKIKRFKSEVIEISAFV